MKKILFALSIALMLCICSIAQTTILFENFEASGTAMPAGWIQETQATDGGWKRGASLGSDYFPIPAHTKYVATNDDGCGQTCNKLLDRLKTPVINCSSYTKVFFSVDILFYKGTYQSKTESADIMLSTDGGTTFTSIYSLTSMDDWYTLDIDITNYVTGQSNVVIAFDYKDDGGWLFGWAIDNVNVYEPLQTDAGATSINMQNYAVINVANTITGTLKNYGSAAINSVSLNYIVNGGAPVSQTLSGLNIAPLASYTYTHNTPWTPTSTGTYTIKVYTGNINNIADQNAANDTVLKTIVVVSQTAPKVCLFEQFTSSTCAPCAAEAPTVNALLDANNANDTASSLAVIKYQMNWPSPGNDPSYNSDGNTRKTYYGVSGIPDFVIDGVEGSNDDQATIDAAVASPAIMNLAVSHSISGNTVTVVAEVTSYATITAATKLHIAIIEKYYNFPGAATSQKDYYYIMRKMLPNGNGTTISPLTESVSKTTTETYTANTVATPPPAQNSYDLWVGVDNISVIAYVQDNASKKVFQAGVSRFQEPVFAGDNAINTKISVYPNPSSNGIINFEINSAFQEIIEINVSNMLGEVVLKERFSNSGVLNTFIDLSTLDNGIYSLSFKNGTGSTITQKLVLNK